MPFLLDGNPSSSEISDAVNYLLSNFDTSYSADSRTGQITGPTGVIVGYLYRYIAVKYADSQDGSLNFKYFNVKKGHYWSKEENERLLEGVLKFGACAFQDIKDNFIII